MYLLLTVTGCCFCFLLFLGAVQTESGCANIVAAAPCQSDPQQYETQYSRLRSFLSGITVTFLLQSLFVFTFRDDVFIAKTLGISFIL